MTRHSIQRRAAHRTTRCLGCFGFLGLAAVAAGGPIPFEDRLITAQADNASGLVVADLDGDGDRDVVVSMANDDRIAWFENADGTFIEHTVSNAVPGASAVAVGDLDGDGDLDLAASAADDDMVFWFESTGGSSPGFTSRVLSLAANRPTDVEIADVDGDGTNDIVVTSSDDNTVAYYRNNGAADPLFSQRIVSSQTFGALDAVAGDIDGDGDMDLASASTFGVNKIAWFENNGAADPTFVEHVITFNAIGANGVALGDLNGDGRLDVVASSGFDDKVRWFANDGAQPPAFEEFIITDEADFARGVFVADLDCDGDADVLSASSSDDMIRWYENVGSGTNLFVTHIVSGASAGAAAVAVGDLDADGTIDVVSCGSIGDSVFWHENLSLPAIPACLGDMDGSGRVDFADLATMLSDWGACPVDTCCPKDLNGDFVVDNNDIATLMGHWGPCPQPGACCLDDLCVELYATECADLGGNFLGSGTECNVRSCVKPEPRRVRRGKLGNGGAGRPVRDFRRGR